LGSDASGYESAPAIAGDLESKECTMADYERDDAGDEVREKADDLGDAAKRGADDVKEGATSLTDRVSDAVEEVIPGDSDGDGH